MALVLSAVVLTSGAITKVTQRAWNEYRVLYTGSNVPVLWSLDQGSCTTSTPTAGGRDFTCDIVPTHARQEGSADFGIDTTWQALYGQATACCREPVPRSSADFGTYLPTVQITGTTLTVQASRIAPILTYVKVGERIVAFDLPSNSPLATWTIAAGRPEEQVVTLDGTLTPNSAYSKSIQLGGSFGFNTAQDVSACAFLPATATFVNGLEACSFYHRNVAVDSATGAVTSTTNWPARTQYTTSSTYLPPSPPPAPPLVPPTPPNPPLPPLPPYVAPLVRAPPSYAMPAPGLSGASIAAIILGIVLGAILLGGGYFFYQSRAVKARASVRVPVEITMESSHMRSEAL